MPDSDLASPDAHEAIAVVAHGLLDSLTGVLVAAHTLRRVDVAAPPADWLLDVVIERSEHVVTALQDLLRGVPVDVVSELIARR